MKKFIVIYHSAPEAMEQMSNATPEQREEGMKMWFAWKDKIGEALIDFGAPLMGGTAINPNGEKSPSTKQVSGYSIVQAENAETATALVENHPHLMWHPTASVELHEYVEMY